MSHLTARIAAHSGPTGARRENTPNPTLRAPLALNVKKCVLLLREEARFAKAVFESAATRRKRARKEVISQVDLGNRTHKLGHQSTQLIVVQEQFRNFQVFEMIGDCTTELVAGKIQIKKVCEIADALWDRACEGVVE